jgi:hypothetical protein
MPTSHEDKIGRIIQIEKALPKEGILIHQLKIEIKRLFLLADIVITEYIRIIAMRNIEWNGKIYPKECPPKGHPKNKKE